MEEPPNSPGSRLKFLCSYGGRILPRPADALLRYVGGETRVLSVPRSITFADLKEKIASMFSAALMLKYQLIAEDLDTLVSVKNDEDLCYMVEEYDRLERRPRSPTTASSPRFRLFLYPSAAAADSAAPVDQRYVEAINGGLPIPDPQQQQQQQIFTISSAGTSPTSADSLLLRTNAGRSGIGMHRVRSTPNLDGGAGNGGAQSSSPRAYKRPTAAFGNSGGSGWRINGGCGGGIRKEVGYGCACSCGCACSAPVMRKYVCSSPLGEGSPPGRGSQGFNLGPSPPPPAPLRVVWE